MNFLKQSTAITLRYGPFLDDTDGKTAETGLTISQADVRLSKAGGAFAQKNDAASGTHDENGWYSIPLNTTDTGTLGMLQVAIHESGALPVFEKFMVVPANVYDSMVGGTDTLQADVTQIDGLATSGNNATLNLKKLNVVNNAGDAIVAQSSGGNGHGINAEGNGSGHGLRVRSAGTGDGLWAEGQNGIRGSANTSANGSGFLVAGYGSGHGISATAGATGNGIKALGGATSGFGMLVQGQGSGVSSGLYCIGGTSGHGIEAVGAGAGAGLKSAGGTTGHGLLGVGGSSAGAGMRLSATNDIGFWATGYYGAEISSTQDDALRIRSTGGNGRGMLVEGNGSGNGISVLAGATGRGLNLEGGGTSGQGMRVKSTGSEALLIDGGTLGIDIGASNGSAIRAFSNGANGSGLEVKGNGSGHGLKATGGASNGDGINATGGITNGDGMHLTGQGSGNDLNASEVGDILADTAAMQPTVATNLNATVSSRSTFDHTSNQVTVAANNDKTGYSISGTKQTLDALNDLSAAQVNAQVDTALSDINLDHLMAAAVTGGDVVDNSALAKIASKSATADWDSFDNTTDALEAIRDNQTSGGDWSSGEKEQIRDALGVSGTKTTATGGQLQTIDTNVDAVLVDTNEMQGKLPTNNIMGSSVKTDKDDEIDAILADTAAMQPTVATNLDATVSSRGTADPGDQMNLADDAITAAKFDESTAYPLASADSGSTQVARVGADGDTLETLSDQIDAVQTDVTSIQNQTRFVGIVPTNMLIPDSGDTMFRLVANFYDNDGNMEDPDNNEIAAVYKNVAGTSKTAFYDDASGTTPATASTTFTGKYKMVRLGVGRYETYYKLPNTESVDQWVAEFALEEASTQLDFTRTSNVVEENPGSTTLADNTTNKDIIAKAMKDRDVSGTGAVSGSIHKDIMDNIDANEAKIDTVDSNVDSIKSTVDTNLNATVSSRSTFDHTSNQVTVATNNDKAGYSISGTKQTLDALNDVSSAQVQSACDSAISANSDIDAILTDTGTTIPAQITSEINDVQADIAGLNDLSSSDVQTACQAAIGAEEPIDANVTQIDGQATNGYNATLKLKQLDIQNSGGDALIAKSTGTNGSGILAEGNGSGHGLECVAGVSGAGVRAAGGATNGTGIFAQGAGTGEGITAQGGTVGIGAYGQSSISSSVGLKCESTATGGMGVQFKGTGFGALIQGTGTGVASGLYCMGATNGHGIEAVGVGSGAGMKAAGGTTGHGIFGQGGSSGGAAMRLSTTNDIGLWVSGYYAAEFSSTQDDAVRIRSTGGNGCGLLIEGNGSGDGVDVQGGATGRGLNLEGGSSSGHGLRVQSSGSAAVLVDGGTLGIDIGASNGSAIRANSVGGNGAGLQLSGSGTGKDLDAGEVGTPVALDGGAASLAGMLTKIADDNAGADFDATTDSLHEIATAMGGVGLTAQQVRDAMKLAPTGGAPAAGSVDEHLDDILTDTAAIQPTVATNLDATVSSRGTADPGDQMNLADDAITSAKYDETTAFPVKSVDSGATEIARTGADGDTLEDLSDQIDAVPTAGEIDTQLTGTHGAGSWQSATPPTAGAIADAVWDEAATGHTGGLKTIHDNVDQSLSGMEDNIRGPGNRDLTEVYNSVDTVESALAVIDSNVDAIVAKLPTGTISDLDLADTVDGVTLSSAFEILMAMANGRYRLNTPVDGQITFYKRDNSTPLFIVNVTDTERSRV